MHIVRESKSPPPPPPPEKFLGPFAPPDVQLDGTHPSGLGSGHGGRLDADPDPPPPRRSKVLRRSGPHFTFGPNLAPKALEKIFWHPVGGNIWLHPLCVCSKCSEFYGEFKCARKTGKQFSPLTFPNQPPPHPQIWLLGPDPQWVNFFKTPDSSFFWTTNPGPLLQPFERQVGGQGARPKHAMAACDGLVQVVQMCRGERWAPPSLGATSRGVEMPRISCEGDEGAAWDVSMLAEGRQL